MVNENGLVKVLDFGLANLTERGGSSEFTRTETIADVPKQAGARFVPAPTRSPKLSFGRAGRVSGPEAIFN
jgi:hypothetical protein